MSDRNYPALYSHNYKGVALQNVALVLNKECTVNREPERITPLSAKTPLLALRSKLPPRKAKCFQTQTDVFKLLGVGARLIHMHGAEVRSTAS